MTTYIIQYITFMNTIFTYFSVNLPFSSRDISIAVNNLLQTTTARRRHSSHSTQTHTTVSPSSGSRMIAIETSREEKGKLIVK